MKKLIAAALVGIMLLPLGACANKSQEAQKSGNKTLNIYVSFHQDQAQMLADKFKEKTGNEVKFIRMPTGEAVTRIESETNSPNADVWIGGTADAHAYLAQKGILTKYESKEESNIPKEFIGTDGVWKGIYAECLAIAYNKERFEKEFAPKGLKPPTTLEDLLNPAYKGEIILPDPKRSGTGLTFVASVFHELGEEKAKEYLSKFWPSVGELTGSGFTPAEKVGKGEFLICVNFFTDQLIVKNNGFPIEGLVYDKAGWNIVPISLIKGGKQEEVAKQFIDFVLSKEAGDEITKISHSLSVRNDAEPPKGERKLSDMPIDRSFSPVEAATQKIVF